MRRQRRRILHCDALARRFGDEAGTDRVRRHLGCSDAGELGRNELVVGNDAEC